MVNIRGRNIFNRLLRAHLCLKIQLVNHAGLAGKLIIFNELISICAPRMQAVLIFWYF